MFEYHGQESPKEPAVAMVRPMTRLGLYLAEMRAWPTEGGRVHEWLEANDAFGARSSTRCERRGRCDLATSRTPAQCRGPRAGGPTTAMSLRCSQFLAWRGEVAVAGRQGRQRLWDVSERIYPEQGEDRPGRKGEERSATRRAAPRARRRASPSTSVTPASPSRSRERPASGASTPMPPPPGSRVAPRSSRRSIG